MWFNFIKKQLIKTMKKTTFLFVLAFLWLLAPIKAQQVQQFTPYDELPSMEKILKPNYDEKIPEWGKMLYQYPTNFYEINKAFKIWEHQELKKTGAKKVGSPLVRYFKIWRKNVQPYVQENGIILLPDIESINAQLTKTQNNATNEMMRTKQAEDNGNWTFWGPKETFDVNRNGSSIAPSARPWQANVYSFDVSDTDENILYCGTETGYINKTTDKGKTWTLLAKDYVFGGGFTAIAIHPTNPDIVYAAAGRKIHKTTDGGLTWEAVANGFDPVRLKIDRNNPDIIAVASWDGIYISSDAGKRWMRRAANDTWDVEIKPDNSNIIYGLTKNGKNEFVLIESTNGGANFQFVSNFPQKILQHSGGLLAVTPANPNILYAVLLAHDGDKQRPYIYKGVRKENGDWTWTKQFTGSTEGLIGSTLTSGQGYFDLVLEASPSDENEIFVGTTSLFKSRDGGKSLYAIGGYVGRFGIHPDIQDMKMLGGKKGMWVATDGGMNYSKDNFTYNVNHIVTIKGLIGSDMWGFDQGWNEDIIVGGRYHNGNTALADFYGKKALSLGGGESATGWVIQGKSRQAAFDDIGNLTLPKTAEGKITYGTFIFSKHPNMDGYGGSRSNVATHPYYSGTLYLGAENSIWISKDYGEYFDLLYDFGGRVKYLNISTANPDVIYADIDGKGFYKTENAGKTWVRKSSPINWKGRITFAISPYDANVVYAADQNGVNWSDVSDVYRTKDGGDTWEKWSNNKFGVKSIVVQPTSEGKDLVYAINTSNGWKSSSVYYRKDGENTSWQPYSQGLPNGFRVNIALPFFRDSKLRVSGNAGVWETPLAEPNFEPIIVPWANKKEFEHKIDTIQLDCHSWLNHKNAKWSWSFSVEPDYISDKNSRNPKVVFNKLGSYDVTLTVTKDGKTYSKTVPNMITVKPSPSIYNCEDPAKLPKIKMRLISADSYQPGNEPTKAFDGNPNTIWHTPWGAGETKYPHHIAIDLGETYNISQMEYAARLGGNNGNINDYELYISNDKENWGTPVAKGKFGKGGLFRVNINKVEGRYVKLVALSEIENRNFASIGELSFVGCTAKPIDYNDCDNPVELPKNDMSLVNADSFQPGNEPTKAFDGNLNTLWHTPWGDKETKHPHHITIDLGKEYSLSKMQYNTRGDGEDNGNIKDYELYVSNDKEKWGEPVAKGTFDLAGIVTFDKADGRYVKLVALNEVKGRAWTSIAELTFLGCNISTGVFNIENNTEITAFPIPTSNELIVNLPYQDGISNFTYTVYAANGMQMDRGKTNVDDKTLKINVTDYAPGYYFVSMQGVNSPIYRVKFIKR